MTLSAPSSLPEDNPPPESSELRELFNLHKEIIVVIKDTLDVFIKIFSPLLLIIPVMMLWIYLIKIGRSEVLLESIGSATGLIAIISFTAIVFLILLWQALVPSWIIANIYNSFPSVRNEGGVKMMRFYVLSPITEIFFLIILFWMGLSWERAVVASFLGFYVFWGVIVLYFCNWKSYKFVGYFVGSLLVFAIFDDFIILASSRLVGGFRLDNIKSFISSISLLMIFFFRIVPWVCVCDI